MRVCEMCGATIPYSVHINGKKHKLPNRVNCLHCVPFGSSRYRKKSIEEQRTLRAKKFRDWYRSQKEKGIDPTNDRKYAQRTFIIELIGGCQFCGYNRLVRNVSFHHVEDRQHELSSRIFGRSLQSLLPELRKCVVCCHNCHGEIHACVVTDDIVAAKRGEFLIKLDTLNGLSWKQAMEKVQAAGSNPARPISAES